MKRPGLSNALRQALRSSGWLLAAIVLSTPVALAGANQWTGGGPVGSLCRALAIDPRNADTVYAGTWGSIFRSRDGGASWSRVFDTTIFGNWYPGLVIDPQSPDVVYGAMAGGVYQSTNAGESWTRAGTFHNAVSIVIDPSDPSRLYAGTSEGLMKSRNRGATWTRVLAADIYNLALSPENPSTVFGTDFDASFYYNVPATLHRSTDGGTNWSRIATPLIINPGSLAIDPTRPSTLYAGSFGVAKSEDSGSTWNMAILPGQFVHDVVLDPSNPRTLYAATNTGVFRSIDSGVTWSDFGRGLNRRGILALAIDATGTRLYAAAELGGTYSYQIQSGAVDLAAGVDQRTHLIFVTPDHLASFRSFDGSGTLMDVGTQALDGWDAKALAVDSGGRRRALWTDIDGSTALEVEGPNGISFRNYGRFGDWSAVDVSLGPADATVILWTNSDGRTALWNLDSFGTRIGGETLGPYADWRARAIAHGADGRVRLLWTNADRRVGVSVIDAGGIVSTVRFAPPSGWTARDLTVAIDGDARVLLSHEDGRMAIWRAGSSGVAMFGPVYEPPLPGQSATRLSAGDDGVTRVLWTNPEGGGTLFLMGLDDALRSSFGLN